jgi:hypothetical protein
LWAGSAYAEDASAVRVPLEVRGKRGWLNWRLETVAGPLGSMGYDLFFEKSAAEEGAEEGMR